MGREQAQRTVWIANPFQQRLPATGHPILIEVDQKGDFFTFEAGASKRTGGHGWADVWKKDFFAWEYKGKHADLDAEYRQLLQYREALKNPPLLVVSDMQHIVIHTNFTNTVKQVYTLELEDLLTTEGRETLRAVFYDPERLRATKTTAHVTAEAAGARPDRRRRDVGLLAAR